MILLRDKKCITITHTFQNVLDESNRKLNKIWLHKGSEFYNKSMKSRLEKKRYRNVFNSKRRTDSLPERFPKTLKNKIYK